MNFVKEMNHRKELIETALDFYMPVEEHMPPAIHEAMRYAVLGGGKRLRPILVLEGARIAGGEVKQALPIACAVEMIHSYSLVHDDLPAMDDDELRRGKPTCHVVYGEAMAILAGDALLTGAFELLAQTALGSGIKPENSLKVIAEIASAAGSRGMIAGQVVDLDSEGKSISEENLRYMHRNKTGALIRAALLSGALLFGASDKIVQALGTYADHLGLAFQITDDILDVEGDQAELGKPVGSDIRHDKSTFVSLFGMEESKKMAQESIRLAIQNLDGFGSEADLLRMLAEQILIRKS
ncbi:MAG: polyprenyl synthetase family protein [Ignavibacteriales bacterium]